MKPDLFEAPDYYNLDELLSEEHKLVREAAGEWVKREISPIIEDYAQKAEFPKQIINGLAEIGAFGPYIPMEYGGAGLDQISYGLIIFLFGPMRLSLIVIITRSHLRQNLIGK